MRRLVTQLLAGKQVVLSSHCAYVLEDVILLFDIFGLLTSHDKPVLNGPSVARSPVGLTLPIIKLVIGTGQRRGHFSWIQRTHLVRGPRELVQAGVGGVGVGVTLATGLGRLRGSFLSSQLRQSTLANKETKINRYLYILESNQSFYKATQPTIHARDGESFQVILGIRMRGSAKAAFKVGQ